MNSETCEHPNFPKRAQNGPRPVGKRRFSEKPQLLTVGPYSSYTAEHARRNSKADYGTTAHLASGYSPRGIESGRILDGVLMNAAGPRYTIGPPALRELFGQLAPVRQ